MSLLVAFLALCRTAGASDLEFRDVNPDASGALPGCSAPCPGAGSGGRVNRLASSAAVPNEVYAASELGGLFKSVDGGGKWQHLDAHLPTKSWDVAADPSGSRVYATSFFDGRSSSLAGIEVSQDGGATWARPASTVPPIGACSALRRKQPSGFGIAIRPGSPGEVLAGTNCGLARSTDSGSTWEFIDPAPADGEGKSVWDVAALPGGLTYACGEEGVMRSPDGKTGWTQLPAPSDSTGDYRGFCSISVQPDFPDAIFIVFSRTTFFDPIFDVRQTAFFFSLDGGLHWTSVPHPDGKAQKRVPMIATNRRWYGLDVWLGAGNLYRAPCKLALRNGTCDIEDPTTWQGTYTDASGDPNKAHGDSGDVLFDPALAADACPLLYSSDGGVYKNSRTSPAGCEDPTFVSANAGLHAELLYGLDGARRSSKVDLYQTLQDIGFFSTTDAVADPPAWSQPFGGDLFDVVADQTQVVVNLGTALDVADPGYLNAVPVPNTPAFSPGFPFFWTFTDVVDRWAADSYVLATKSPDVVYTTNLNRGTATAGSVSWHSLHWPAKAGLPCWVQASRSTGRSRRVSRFYVMSGDCLWRSSNQLWSVTKVGKKLSSWKRLDDNPQCPGGGFGIFGVDSRRPGRISASCTGLASPTIVRSEDDGKTWGTDVVLTDLMTAGGEFVPRYQEALDGATFGGVQPVMVAYDPADADILLAGGYDSGVFISSDGAKSWALLSDPHTPATSLIPHLPRPFFVYFDHETGGPLGAIYIGTVGRGVWRVAPAKVDLHLTLKVTKLACRTGCEPEPCFNCPITFGNLIEHLYTVTNASGPKARNVVFRQTLPQGLAFQSLDAPRGWACATPAADGSGAITCKVDGLAPGDAAQLAVRTLVRARHGKRLRSEALVASSGIDPNPSDNRRVTAHRIRSSR